MLTKRQTDLVTDLLCEELVRLETPAALKKASEGVQWAVTAVRENRANINYFVSRVLDNPRIQEFLENQQQRHGDEPLSRQSREYLLHLVRITMGQEKGRSAGAAR